VVRWYCLLVEPQKEILARNVLVELGFNAYLPVEIRIPQINKRRGKPKSFVYVRHAPALGARYLFIGVAGPLPVFKLRRIHFISGVLCRKYDGVTMPAQMTEEAMTRVRSVDQVTGAMPVPRKTSLDTRRTFAAGDNVTAVKGPLCGNSFKIVEFQGHQAIVKAKFLGGEHLVAVALRHLEHE